MKERCVMCEGGIWPYPTWQPLPCYYCGGTGEVEVKPKRKKK